MKALIPVAGAGTRLRPHTYTQPKPLIPVAGKPIIAAIIEQLQEYGIEEFVFVIGYLGDKIRKYIEDSYPDLKKLFIYQEERLGLGHAIWLAQKEFMQEPEFLIMLGDTILDGDLKGILSSKTTCLGVKKVEDPREFGVVVLDEDRYIRKVVEKPRIPKSNMAIVGIYKICEVPELIAALSYIIEHEVKTMGEFQLTDALMQMVRLGCKISVCPISNWFDCGKKEILLATNAMLLQRRDREEGTHYSFTNTIIIPPVRIGKGCKIENSILGPNVSVGDGAQLKQAIIYDSIIGNYASIEEAVLKRSIIGSDASVKGLSQSLNIGDNTEIDFS